MVAASTLAACGADGTSIQVQAPTSESRPDTTGSPDGSIGASDAAPESGCATDKLLTAPIAADALATLTHFDADMMYQFDSYPQLRDYSDIAIEAILVNVRRISDARTELGVHLDGSIEVDFEVIDVLGGRERPVSNPDATEVQNITVVLPVTLEEPFASQQFEGLDEVIGKGRFVIFLDRQITGGIGEERFTNLYIPSTLPTGTPSAILFEDEDTGRLVRLAPQDVWAQKSNGHPAEALRCISGLEPEGSSVASAIETLRSAVGTVTTARPSGAYEITEQRRASARPALVHGDSL